MPYSDLINASDVIFRASFNSSKTPEIAGVFTNTTAGSGTITTGNPFSGSSLTVQEQTTISPEIYYFPNSSSSSYYNAPSGIGQATIVECWVYYTVGASNAVAAWEIVDVRENNVTYGDSSAYTIRINPGTYTGTGTAGTLQVMLRDAGGVTTINSTDFLIPNQWNLIHIDRHVDKRCDIFINGKYSNSTGGTLRGGNNIIGFQIGDCWAIQGSAGDSTMKIAEFVSYNRKLTHDEKYLRYRYGQTIGGFVNTQLTDGALVQMRFDNPNKSTPMTLYGSASSTWGSTFPDVGSTKTGITAYQPGAKDYQWNILQGAASTQQIFNGNAAFAAALQQVMQSGNSYSFEFVLKIPSTFTQTHRIFEFGSNSTTGTPSPISGGYVLANISTSANGKGQPSVSHSYQSISTGAWQSGSLSGIPNPSSNTSSRNYYRLDEGNWYHFVVNVDRSTTNLSVVLYANAVGMKNRSYGTGTYNSNGTNSAYTYTTNDVAWGPNTVTADATWGYDNFAIYNRLLTATEIENHYWALVKAEKSIKYWNGNAWTLPTGTKVWDGTAWIDWNTKYYDGTQWITV